MLVCSKCGTEAAVAGHPCPACGHRGAVEARFFRGEIRAAPAVAPDDLATHAVSEAGTLPAGDRAWSPWLAAAVALAFGPAAGALVAGWNLRRFNAKADPWLATLSVVVLQMIGGVAAGFTARSNPSAAWGLLGFLWLLILAGLVRWQWRPVAAQRQARPGHHVPGAEAFGVFLLAAVVGALAGWLVLFVADNVSQHAFMAPVNALFPAPPPPAPPPSPMMPF